MILWLCYTKSSSPQPYCLHTEPWLGFDCLLNSASASYSTKTVTDGHIATYFHYPKWVWAMKLGRKLMSLELSVGRARDGHTFWDSPRIYSCQSTRGKAVLQAASQAMWWNEGKTESLYCYTFILDGNFLFLKKKKKNKKTWNQTPSFCATTFLPNSHVSSLP